MIEEIMPREDRMGKILSFIGGCVAGIVGVFAVAVMSEIAQDITAPSDSFESNVDKLEADRGIYR